MIIGSISENKDLEKRISITPDIAKKYIDLGFEIQIGDLTQEMFTNADEAFFTGTASEITPIASVDDSLIGGGKPGTITLQIKEKYLNIIHGKDNSYKHWLTLVRHKNAFDPIVSE